MVVGRAIGLLVAFALCGCTECSGASEAKREDAQPPPTLSFEEEERHRVQMFSHQAGYGTLQSIPAVDLLSYVSGYYRGGHSFPAIFLDPKERTLTVIHSGIRQSYKAAEIDQALDSYRTVLVNHGYEIHGQTVDTNRYLWVDGHKMAYVNLADVFPEQGEVKSHFTAAQYEFIYSKLDGWSAFSYLAGLGGDVGRDHPLMVGLGYKETARLRVLAKDLAREFRFDQLDAAFACYRQYVEQRLSRER